MKKLQALLKNKAYGKNPEFKKLFDDYKSAVKAYREASVKKQKAKAKYLALKKKKASKSDLLKAACVLNLAGNNRKMCNRIMKISLQYLLRWVKIYEECIKRGKLLAAKPKKSDKKKKKKKTKKKEKVEPKATITIAKKIVAKKSSTAPKKSKPEKSAKPTTKKKTPAKTTPPMPTPAKSAAKPKVKTKPKAKTTPPMPTPSKPAAKQPAQKPAARAAAPRKDDLKMIEGIGPKIQELMYAARIYSFNQVARSSVARLQGVLDKAGRRYSLADPTSWPQQAKLANSGKWEELKKLQDELKGGKVAK